MQRITLKDAYRIAERYPMFYAREHGPYVLFSYHWQNMSVFRKCPEARELRGVVFDRETGEIVSRPFPKFFNFGEPCCNVDPDTEVSLNEKLDGSLVVASSHDGELVITSRGSFSSWVVNEAKQLLTPAHVEMISALDCSTFMFELLSPDNPIVIRHDTPELVLVGIREKVSGYHFTPEEIVYYSDLMGIKHTPLVGEGKILAGDVHSQVLAGRENFEGVVGYASLTELVKFKTPWYIERHRYFGEISEKVVLSDFINGTLDDIQTDMPEHIAEQINAIVERASATIEESTMHVREVLAGLDVQRMSRKEYALHVLEHGRSDLKPVFFAVYDGMPIDSAVYEHYRRKWSCSLS